MTETIRRANKEHKCAHCNGVIYPKNKYSEYRGRSPKYDDNDNQVGIEYFITRTHLDVSCIGRLEFLSINEAKEIFKKCNKGNHEYVEHYEFDHYVGDHRVGAPTGFFFCKTCMKRKD